jgi:hypothetical protein
MADPLESQPTRGLNPFQQDRADLCPALVREGQGLRRPRKESRVGPGVPTDEEAAAITIQMDTS